jgi:hypothetical protein
MSEIEAPRRASGLSDARGAFGAGRDSAWLLRQTAGIDAAPARRIAAGSLPAVLTGSVGYFQDSGGNASPSTRLLLARLLRPVSPRTTSRATLAVSISQLPSLQHDSVRLLSVRVLDLSCILSAPRRSRSTAGGDAHVTDDQ